MDGRNGLKATFGYKSSSPPPAVLHVNREARTEALHYYKLTFGTEYASNTNGIGGCSNLKPTIYANFESDRLWFRGDWRDLNYRCYWAHFFGYGVRRVALAVGPGRSAEGRGHSVHSCHLWLHWPVEEISLYHLEARGITFGRSTIETRSLNEENCGKTEWEEFEEAEGEIDYVLDLWHKDPASYKVKMKKELEQFWAHHLGHMDSDNGSSKIFPFEGQGWKAPLVKKIMLV